MLEAAAAETCKCAVPWAAVFLGSRHDRCSSCQGLKPFCRAYYFKVFIFQQEAFNGLRGISEHYFGGTIIFPVFVATLNTTSVHCCTGVES